MRKSKIHRIKKKLLNWDEIIAQIDESIKIGKIKEGAEILQSITISEVPNKYKTTLARLAQRCDLFSWGLKLLYTNIKNDLESKQVISEEEKLTYASLLIRNGLYEEGILLLQNIKSPQFPEKLLYTAHANILKWNPDEAIKYFKKYLESPKLTEYQKLVTQLNLASCYIDLFEFSIAKKILTSVNQEALSKKHYLVYGNTFELLAQIEIFYSNYEEAKKLLDSSLGFLSNSHPRYLFYIKKWRQFAEALQYDNGFSFDEIRREAEKIKEWESLREIDLFEAWIRNDTNLAKYVIYGSPYEKYIYRIKKFFPNLMIPKNMIIFDKNQETTIDSLFNLEENTLTINRVNLKNAKIQTDKRNKVNISKNLNKILLTPITKLQKKLLQILLSDFYKPFNIGRIFSNLYPEEYFNPYSSPLKVNFVIYSLRQWIKKNNLSLKIIKVDSNYKIMIGQNLSLCLFYKQTKLISLSEVSISDNYFKIISDNFKTKTSFSPKEVSQLLGISLSQANKHIKNWHRKRKIKINSNFKKKILLVS